MKDFMKDLIFIVKIFLYGFIVAAMFSFMWYKIDNSIIPIGLFLYTEALATMISGVWIEMEGKAPWN